LHVVVAVPAQFARADGFVAKAGVEAVCVGVCLIDVQANAGFVAGKRHFGQGAQQRFAAAARDAFCFSTRPPYALRNLAVDVLKSYQPCCHPYLKRL